MPVQRWILISVLSGAASLAYESLWLRRLGLVLGGSATASATTLAVFMGGLGIGALLSARLARPARTYAALEVFAALWALGFPYLPAHALLPLPAAIALGATWPLLARGMQPRDALTLYAANTGGAVLGVLVTTFVLMPWFGVRTSELIAVVAGLTAAGLALTSPPLADSPPTQALRPEPLALYVAFSTGALALGLEVLWMRLAAVGLGATVQTFGLVLGVFLATTALGAHLGRSWPNPRYLSRVLLALGGTAVVGTWTWGLLPYAVGLAYPWLGPRWLWMAHAALATVWMTGAPVLSGLAFGTLLRRVNPTVTGGNAAWLYASNTAGATLGAAATGLVLLPTLGPGYTVLIWTVLALLPVLRTQWPGVLTIAVVGLMAPGWNARLYAVGVHLRISDFDKVSIDSISSFADENWELVHYEHGRTAAVAVGRSTQTGNVWLSINGKVDASTGDDMPTQELSARIPLSVSRNPEQVAIVGLASGVTAGTALEDPRIRALTVFELEPAVVRASHFFDHVNRRPLDDPRTTLRIEDARAAFQEPTQYDVIISEPSNPWITGVSNLFTQEYWELARSRLRPDGVFCQWVQLYGMGPEEFRALVRTFDTVFDEVTLYETIEGSDILLIASPHASAAHEATLSPVEVRALGGLGWLNTDDHPRIEWNAPSWLHYDTAGQNAKQIRDAKDAYRGPM